MPISYDAIFTLTRVHTRAFRAPNKAKQKMMKVFCIISTLKRPEWFHWIKQYENLLGVFVKTSGETAGDAEKLQYCINPCHAGDYFVLHSSQYFYPTTCNMQCSSY